MAHLHAGTNPAVVAPGGDFASPAVREYNMGAEAPGMSGYGPGYSAAPQPVGTAAPAVPGATPSGMTPRATTPPGTVPATGSNPQSALSAWDQFRNSTNYQWRLNEGTRALEQQFAAHGALDSGAAVKSAVKYNQEFAANELSNYMNLLAGQQAMGLSAAGAVAGVGTNYAGNVAAQNTNAANAAANAALMQGQASANQWGAIGGAAGQLGGALYQYGMGQMQPQYGYAPSGGTPNYGAVSSLPPVYTPGGF